MKRLNIITERTTISEVVSFLSSKGFDVSSQQLRKYHTSGLISPSRSGNKNSRYFTQTDVTRIEVVLWLRLIGFSILEIKEFLDRYSKYESLLSSIYTRSLALKKVKTTKETQSEIERLRTEISQLSNTIFKRSSQVQKLISDMNDSFAQDLRETNELCSWYKDEYKQ